MEADPSGEDRTCSKNECRFACALIAACMSVVLGGVGVYALLVESRINAALSLSVAAAVVCVVSLFFALYFKRKIPNPRAIRPSVEAHELEARAVVANPGSNERLNVDAENASASSDDPSEQLSSGEPSSGSLKSDKKSLPESLHSEDRSNIPAPVPEKPSATLPDVASAGRELASECATGKEIETQTASTEDQQSSENSTENEAEKSDSSEMRCRKRSPKPFPGD